MHEKKYNTAVSKGRTLTKRLGRGWRPRTWENLGWYYSAVYKTNNIKLSVYSNTTSDFSAYCDGKVANGKTPRKAIEAVTAEISTQYAHLSCLLRSLRLKKSGTLRWGGNSLNSKPFEGKEEE